MTDSDWSLLCLLAEERNITNVATRLYVSQSTVSYRIKAIESELGVTILHRSRTGVSFTSDGMVVLKYAQESLTRLNALKNSFKCHSTTLNGSLRLGVSTSIAYHVLPYLLKAFSSFYPDIDIIPKSNRSTIMIDMLHQNEVDLAIVRSNVEPCENAELLYEEPLFLVSKSPVNEHELSSQSFLHHINAPNDDTMVWVRETLGETSVPIIDVDNIEVCLQLLSAGLGWTILPGLTLASRRSLFTKPIYFKSGAPVTRKTWLLVQNSPCSPEALAFCAFCREKLPTYLSSILPRISCV